MLGNENECGNYQNADLIFEVSICQLVIGQKSIYSTQYHLPSTISLLFFQFCYHCFGDPLTTRLPLPCCLFCRLQSHLSLTSVVGGIHREVSRTLHWSSGGCPDRRTSRMLLFIVQPPPSSSPVSFNSPAFINWTWPISSPWPESLLMTMKISNNTTPN